MAPTDAPDGWEHAVHGATGGLALALVARRGGDKGEVELRPDWSFTRGEGSAREQLLATRAVLAALGGRPIELFRPDGAWLSRAIMQPPDDSAQWRELLLEREAFLAYVAEVEAWLGRELFPPAAPTEADAKALGAIIPLIRKPETSLNWTRVEMTPGGEAPEGSGPWQFALLQPLWADLFGERIYLGMELVHFPEGRIDTSGDNLAIVPVGESGHGTSRLHHPDEVPPEAARRPLAPEAASQAPAHKVGRNDSCPCGSGQKYKKCHGP